MPPQLATGRKAGEGRGQHVILVVDDQSVNRLLLQQYLEREDYAVLLATSGSEALKILYDRPVDMVLLDVVMKGMDGYEVCRRIKADDRTLLIPVVMVTILQNREDRIKALEAGADEFLSRPIYPEELLARVRSLIRWHDARRELQREQQDQIRNAFKRYMCPKMVDDILSSPDSELRSMLGHTARRDAVALFTDLRGFTSVSESIPGEQVVAILNEYFSVMAEVAHAYEGTIFNMAGDSLLVGFGVPFDQTALADRALDCARAMQRAFRQLQEGWCSRYAVQVGLGIGINRGELLFGNVGSDAFASYTIIGDTVNVAQRLQQIAADGEIVISESLALTLTGERMACCVPQTDPVSLKGRRQSIRVYSCCVRGLD